MEDVLVIGAGPAGSRTAAMLAKQGHRVTVLEEHSQAGSCICCTGIVGRECFLHLGPDSSVLREAKSASFVSPNGRLIRLEKGTPQAYILDRSKLDKSLAKRAQEEGAEFVFGCSVENVLTQNDRVEVESILDGRRVSFRSRALVLACGFNPGLISRLGLGRMGDFAVGAQAEIDVDGAEEVEIRFSRRVAPGFFAWIVPTTGKRCLVGLMCREFPGSHLRSFLAQLHEEGRVGSPDVQVKYGRIPLKPPKLSYGSRVLLVGDAAGQVKPTTGGGIYYGVLCADKAAEVLDGALREDDLSKERLSEYQRAWKQALNDELRIGYLSRMAFERLGDKAIDKLFDIVRDYSLDKVALNMEGFSFDWHGRVLGKALAHHAVMGVLSSGLRGMLGPSGTPERHYPFYQGTSEGQLVTVCRTPPSDGECATRS